MGKEPEVYMSHLDNWRQLLECNSYFNAEEEMTHHCLQRIKISSATQVTIMADSCLILLMKLTEERVLGLFCQFLKSE